MQDGFESPRTTDSPPNVAEQRRRQRDESQLIQASPQRLPLPSAHLRSRTGNNGDAVSRTNTSRTAADPNASSAPNDPQQAPSSAGTVDPNAKPTPSSTPNQSQLSPPDPAAIAAAKTDRLSPTLAAVADVANNTSTNNNATNGTSSPPPTPNSGPGSPTEEDGSYLSYVRYATTTTAANTQQALTNLGANIVNVAETYATVTAYIPQTQLRAAANINGVVSIVDVKQPLIAQTTQTSQATTANAQTQSLSPQVGCAPPTTSEATTQLRTALARTNYNVDGTGIKIGVLSDSYNANAAALTHAAGDIANGELPGVGNPCGRTTPVTVLNDYANGADEGRAMMQAIHDIAPGAELAFNTAAGGEYAFAANIRALRAWGANIIVDDISYLYEPFFQDGPVSVAINDVTADGATYFSSAGNNNIRVGGVDLGSYETTAFRPVACPATLNGHASVCHDFDTTAGVDTGWGFTLGANNKITVDLQWAEPFYGVTDDIELFVLDAATDAIVWSSVAGNTTSGVPAELISSTNGASSRDYNIVIGRYFGNGTPRFKFSFLSNGGATLTNVQYASPSNPDIAGPTIFGHNGGLNTISVAAIAYNNSTSVESYSSRGPLALYFGPVNGAAPAAALGSPTALVKPDITATDGAQNSFFGANFGGGIYRFYGTSQAAPHAAAATALIMQKRPAITSSQVRTLLRQTASAISLSNAAAAGTGLVDTNAAIAALPTITSLSTTSGLPGTSVVITGTNFTNIDAVKFNQTPAASFAVNSSTQITAVSPSGATSGPITVSAPFGYATSASSFGAINPPTIATFTPSSGVPGTDITITGANLNGATSVSFNGIAASAFSVQSDTQLTATVPAGSTTGFIAVQTPGGVYTTHTTFTAGYWVYTGNSPARLADTRAGQSTIDGQYTGVGKIGQGGTLDLPVLGRGGVPATGVGAVALNVTVTEPTAPSYLTVYPSGQARPLAANLNYTPGQTVPNMVIAKVGSNGAVALFNNAGETHVVVDVMGWFPDTGGFTSLTPARLADTRAGQATTDGQFSGNGLIGQGQALQLTVRGRGGVPAGVGAVALNVTVTEPTAPSYLTVYPSGQARPLAANLNYTPGQTVPNMVIAKVGSDGKVMLYNNAGSTHIVVDVLGWFTETGGFESLTPARLSDTRTGQLTFDGQNAGSGVIGQGGTYSLPVRGRGGVPSTGVGAVAFNVTVTEPTGNSYLTVFPSGTSRPLAANLNYTPGQTVPNMVIAKVGSNGAVSFFNNSGNTHIVVDVLGWFPDTGGPLVAVE